MSFFGGSSSPPPPQPASTQTVSQTSEFPEEIKPFITDVLEKAKAQQEGRQFEKFEGPRLAEFTPEQEAAFAGISGIAEGGLGAYPGLASSAFYAQQAQDAAEQGLKQFDITEAERLMNPFQQGVTDIEKREAIRQFEGVTQPQIGAQAVGEGGFGGSRHAILEAEAQRNLQQQLGDIQARGLRDAYTTAANQFEQERARQAAGAGQFAGFAQQFPAQGLRELGAIQSIGETKQARDQRALDIALSDFLTEQEFPTRQLQEYQSLIRGFPIAPNVFRQEVQSVPSVPLSQQLLGLAGTGLQTAALSGAFKPFQSGGQIQGGLSSLERHQDIGNSFIKRTMEHDPMATTLTEQMIQKAKLLNQGVSEEVADRIVVSMQNPELKGTGASGDPLIMEQKALEEIRERRAREADRIGKNVGMTGAGKEYLDEVKRVGESGRSYELAKRGYKPTEKHESPYGLQDLSKRSSDQNQGFAQKTSVALQDKVADQITDSQPDHVRTPSTRHTTEAWNKTQEYESEARRLGDLAAQAATDWGHKSKEQSDAQIEVSEGIFNRGKELLEKGEVDFKTFMDDRTTVMTDIYNKGLERINKIEDESQRRIAQDETNNLFGFIGTVLANQVNDPRGALVGIATASAEAFPEHAKRQHTLSKESRDMVKEIEGLRGEADAEYARQGLKTKELNYKEQVRLDKELYTMRNNLEMNKVTFKTEGEKALYEGKMRALEAKIAALGATNTTINTALEIAKIEDDRYNAWLDRQVEIGKMNEEQRAASVKFMNDVSLDSTERMLMIDSLRSSFGDQIQTDGKGGIALLAEIGSDAQQALAALQGAVARAKQIYGRVGHVKEGTPMNVRIKGEDVQIPLREGYAMNIGDIYDQISPYFAGGSKTSGRTK